MALSVARGGPEFAPAYSRWRPTRYLGEFSICFDTLFLFLAFAFVSGSAHVAAAITHFISFEVGNLIDAL